MGKPQTDGALDAPPLVDDVVVTIHKAAPVKVALETIITQLVPNAERQSYVTGIVMHIQQMRPDEMAAERSTNPIPGLGLHRNVPPLLVVLEGKGVVTEREVERPLGCDTILKSEIG